jgi:hypothetical protein
MKAHCLWDRKDGRPCACRKGLRLVGGVLVCEFHARAAARAFEGVIRRLGPDHPVVTSAVRDTAERNR